jgi:ubiquinone/menaquinone biosynthesis C-methylase UbiE
MHLNSRLLFEKYALDFIQPGMKVLEIGPNECPSVYQKMAQRDGVVWHTVDIQQNAWLTYRMSDEYSFPIESESYDVVLSGQVIEHVRKIWVWMREVARVCKAGGTVISVNPVSYGYHESPIDCWRIFPEGMKALYDDCGLDSIVCIAEALEPRRVRVRQFARLLRSLALGRKLPMYQNCRTKTRRQISRGLSRSSLLDLTDEGTSP